MGDLRAKLARLGLSEYTESLIDEGFDTWETVIDITESDLDTLKVKLGHRRKLQRAIAESRQQLGDGHTLVSPSAAPITEGIQAQAQAPEGIQDGRVQKKTQHKTSGSGSGGVKRKYRRHPKPDEFAPERPASAYVIFSNQMREALKPQDLSFTELAKVIGEKWQLLSSNTREEYERRAATAKEKYNYALADYKRTEKYSRYQAYLVEFKAKQATQQAEGKRVKLQPETSYSARGSSHGSVERSPSRRASRESPDAGPSERGSPPLTSPSVAYSQYGGYEPPHQPTPPMPQSYSHVESPPRRQHSPMSLLASATTALTYERVYHTRAQDWHTSHPTSPLNIHPIHTSPYERINRTKLASEPPQLLTYTNEQLARRNRTPSSPVPPLIHEDTSISSESGSSTNVTLHALLDPDVPRTQRLLPKPVTSSAAILPPLDKRPPMVQSHLDLRYSSSLAALLRAGDLAREADAQLGPPG